MTSGRAVPTASYGILQKNLPESALDEAAERIRNIGYAVIDSGLGEPERRQVAKEFNDARKRYVRKYGEANLRKTNEYFTIRSPLTHGGPAFLRLALNPHLLSLMKKLIQGKFILNQQNGVINPPRETFNQGAWHRDLPYQHFVSSKPLAVNALYCVDDFTRENGATFVLPASHKSEAFPSPRYIEANAVQIEAKAGAFIFMDCMIYHAGGHNGTRAERRGVNHVYNIPYFRQQINIPRNLKRAGLSAEDKDVLGFPYAEPGSVADYLATRKGKAY